jgi:serine/threonine-protein kinase
LSPDGRWLAYVSDESGRQEVYVRSFPGLGGRIQVSVNGGSEPVWTRSGREIVYREDVGTTSRMISAAVLLSPEFVVLSRTALFDVADDVTSPDHANFDVTPNGERFVMIRASQRSRLNLIQDWVAQFKQR